MGGDNSIPHARLTGTYAIGERYPAAMINVTNRCNLQCEHCFIYRDGNPNLAPERVRDEISEEVVLDTLVKLRDKYGIAQMLWMGGEPLLRRSLVARGIPLFARNTITTNGTVALTDFGPEVLYVVSLDGPRELNDVVRGAGVFDRVKRNLARIPADEECDRFEKRQGTTPSGKDLTFIHERIAREYSLKRML